MPMTSATLAASRQSWRDEQYSSSSSSSQFFMNRPTTSWPCCLSSQAVTAESTPPDRPTTMRLREGMQRFSKARRGTRRHQSRRCRAPQSARNAAFQPRNGCPDAALHERRHDRCGAELVRHRPRTRRQHFHPEDAAAMAVRSAARRSKADSAAPLSAPQQPAPSKVRCAAGQAARVEVAQRGNVDDKPEPALG